VVHTVYTLTSSQLGWLFQIQRMGYEKHYYYY
jgi:hypothetical protein